MISTERMNAIVKDLVLGKEPEVEGDEEQTFAKEVRAEIEQAQKEGRTVDFAKTCLMDE